MYVASAPIDPVRATAIAELPHLSRGINDVRSQIAAAARAARDKSEIMPPQFQFRNGILTHGRTHVKRTGGSVRKMKDDPGCSGAL